MGQRITDIEFVRRPQRALTLDLFLPEDPEGPLPLAVWIYGGGWSGGSKESCQTEYLTAHGFAAASIEYRYSQEAIFPAAIEDCHAAICWLKAHAGQYGLDAGRVGVMGPSAGGHLAALLGTSGQYVNWSGSDGAPDCGSVQAVIDVSGPTLLSRCAQPAVAQQYAGLTDAVAQLLGGSIDERLSQARDASPLSYVHPKCPPFLILHGRQDSVVPIEEAELLHQCLLAAGVDSTYLPVTDAGHGIVKDWVPPMILDFFSRTLAAQA